MQTHGDGVGTDQPALAGGATGTGVVGVGGAADQKAGGVGTIAFTDQAVQPRRLPLGTDHGAGGDEVPGLLHRFPPGQFGQQSVVQLDGHRGIAWGRTGRNAKLSDAFPHRFEATRRLGKWWFGWVLERCRAGGRRSDAGWNGLWNVAVPEAGAPGVWSFVRGGKGGGGEKFAWTSGTGNSPARSMVLACAMVEEPRSAGLRHGEVVEAVHESS